MNVVAETPSEEGLSELQLPEQCPWTAAGSSVPTAEGPLQSGARGLQIMILVSLVGRSLP